MHLDEDVLDHLRHALNSLAAKSRRIGFGVDQMSKDQFQFGWSGFGIAAKARGNTGQCHQYHLALGYLNLYQVG